MVTFSFSVSNIKEKLENMNKVQSVIINSL